MRGDESSYAPLFESETRRARGTLLYRIFSASLLVCILTVLIYRATHLHLPGEDEEEEDTDGWRRRFRSWGWMGILSAELWFALYWILAQSLRWNPVRRSTFKHSLQQRYENELPKVDVFVCTTNATIEPPLMVVNTVLSVMAYDYLPEKLSVYLSDDGGSDITFYALWEALTFARHWLPYCRCFNIEPRSPAAYFKCTEKPEELRQAGPFCSIKKLYEDMAKRIEDSTKLGRVPGDIRCQHKGFSDWDSYTSKHDHDTILQILIAGWKSDAKDVEGNSMPNLIYLAREKRPQHFHNFKAGAMNALIRVSSQISNGPIILNVDCDMYSNNSQSIRDALCFFMDSKQSQGIGFVQFPQIFENLTKNDLYGSSLCVIREVELYGLDGVGGPSYMGSGCFHQREVLCGRKYEKEYPLQWRMLKNADNNDIDTSMIELEHNAKVLASCTYELNTQWGKEMGIKYGCPLEDIITGLSIQCRGWKTAYYNPRRPGFMGVAPSSLNETLVQHKRWSEGDFQIFLSKYCPLWFGYGKISLLLQMGYVYYCLWACNCFATLFYTTIPSLFLINGISLFPEVSSPWFIPFAYIIIATYGYSLVEFLQSQGTSIGWWNDQRMWLYKRVSSYLFAFVDSIMKLVGFSNMNFVITAKVADEDVTQRYMQEKMEFGVSSPMFTILATLALVNLSCLAVVVKRFAMGELIAGKLSLQVLLCLVLVILNLPLYESLFLRKDKGKIPISVTLLSTVLSSLICVCFWFSNWALYQRCR